MATACGAEPLPSRTVLPEEPHTIADDGLQQPCWPIHRRRNCFTTGDSPSYTRFRDTLSRLPDPAPPTGRATASRRHPAIDLGQQTDRQRMAPTTPVGPHPKSRSRPLVGVSLPRRSPLARNDRMRHAASLESLRGPTKPLEVRWPLYFVKRAAASSQKLPLQIVDTGLENRHSRENTLYGALESIHLFLGCILDVHRYAPSSALPSR